MTLKKAKIPSNQWNIRYQGEGVLYPQDSMVVGREVS